MLKPLISSTLKRARVNALQLPSAKKRWSSNPSGKPSKDGWRLDCYLRRRTHFIAWAGSPFLNGPMPYRSKVFLLVFFGLGTRDPVGPYQPSIVLSAVTAFFS